MSLAIIIVAVLVVVLVIWQTIQLQAMRRKVDGVPSDENVVATLRAVTEGVSANSSHLNAVDQRLKSVEDRVPHAVSRVGVVAYDAFGDIAGNQSRSIALLNEVGNGLVITLLTSREETMFFTKEVRAAKGVQGLSPEEQVAVDRAMGN